MRDGDLTRNVQYGATEAVNRAKAMGAAGWGVLSSLAGGSGWADNPDDVTRPGGDRAGMNGGDIASSTSWGRARGL